MPFRTFREPLLTRPTRGSSARESLARRAAARSPRNRRRGRGPSRASCARSSATPTSRVRRVRPAISRGDSMRQTASIALPAKLSLTRSDARPVAPANRESIPPPLERQPESQRIPGLAGLRSYRAHPLDSVPPIPAPPLASELGSSNSRQQPLSLQ